MMSEPWLSTTFPSKVETFLASSVIMLLASLLIVLIHHHPDPRQDRAPFGNRDRVIRTRDPLFGEYVQEFRASAKFGSLRRCLAQEEHIAVQESLLALAIDGAAIGGRDVVSAVSGNLNEARIN